MAYSKENSEININDKFTTIAECEISTLNIYQENHVKSNVWSTEPIKFGISLDEIELIGREKEIEEIYVMIKKYHRVAITGLAGIGKTSLSIYCAQKWSRPSNNFINNIIFLNCEEKKFLQNSFKYLANYLNIKSVDEIGFTQTTREIFEKLNTNITLYIYDNIDDCNVIKDYLPPKNLKNSYVILTSQIKEWGSICKCYSLEMLTAEKALDLIMHKLEITEGIDREKIEQINFKFNGYPLGIIHACGFINYEMQNPVNNINEVIDNYICEFETKFNDLPELLEEKYENTIKIAITLNYEKVLNNSKYYGKSDVKIGVDLIIKLLVFAVTDIMHSKSVLNLNQYGFIDKYVKRALWTVIKYSIINLDKHKCLQHDIECDVLYMHRTVRKIIKDTFLNTDIIKILCQVLQYFEPYLLIENVLALLSQIKEKSIFECSESQWKMHCDNICCTPGIIALVNFILKELKNVEKSEKYLNILFKKLIKTRAFIYLYKWSDGIRNNFQINNIFQTVLEEQQLSINELNKNYEKLLLKLGSYNFMNDLQLWIDVHWLSFYGLVDTLREIQTERLLSRHANGWTVIHVGAITGNTEILHLFTREELHNFMDVGACEEKVTAVILCVIFKNIDYLNILLENNFNINSVDKCGKSALYYTNDANIAKLLIDKNININLLDNKGGSALHTFTKANSVEIVKLLVEEGVNVNEIDHNGVFPLSVSLRQGKTEISQILLDYNADIEKLNPFEKYILFLNVKSKLLSYELQYSSSSLYSYEQCKYVLYWVVDCGITQIVNYVINYEINIKLYEFKDEKTMLQFALKYGHMPLIRRLINALSSLVKNPIEMFACFLTILRRSLPYSILLYFTKQNKAFLNFVTNVTLVFSYIFNLDTDLKSFKFKYQKTILQFALEKGNMNLIQLLINNFKRIDFLNEYQSNILIWAVTTGKLENPYTTIDFVFDVNITDKNGNNIIHWMARTGMTEINKLITNFGVDINLENKQGNTALHISVQNKNKKIVELLLKRSATINKINAMGKTPLNLAIDNNEVDISILLLKHGAFILPNYQNRIKNFLAQVENGLINSMKIFLHDNNINICDDMGRTALHIAVIHNRIEIVKYLLKCGANVNVQNKKLHTPLHLTTFHGNVEMAQFLLDYGADLNIKDIDDNTVLHWAANSGKTDILEYFLRHGAIVDVKNKSGFTPLHKAIINNNIKTLQVLLNYRADINIENKYKSNPFHLAILLNKLDIVKYLLEYGKKLSLKGVQGFTSLQLAISNGCLETFQLLVKYGVDINITNENGDSVLHLAIIKNKLEVIPHLIKLGADINLENKMGLNPLHLIMVKFSTEKIIYLLDFIDITKMNDNGTSFLIYCIMFGKLEIFKYLLKHGVDINHQTKQGVSLLHQVIKYNNIDMLQFLTKSGVDINKKDEDGNSPLYWSVALNNSKLVQHLLRNGADVNLKNNEKNSPMHRVVESGSIEILQLLVNYKANINILDKNGKSPLHWCASFKKIELAQYLIENGANVNLKSNEGVTPLHESVQTEDKRMINLLLDRGADITVVDEDGNSALHWSIILEKSEVAEHLIKYGVTVNLRNKHGDSPLHYCIVKNNLEIAELLIDNGIDINLFDTQGDSALNWAAESGNIEMAKLLLSHGANVNLSVVEQITALQWASRHGNVKMVHLLLQHNADVNLQSVYGLTPLHWAVWEENKEVIEILLTYSVNVNLKNIYNKTALHWAVQSNQTDIVELILNFNDNINFENYIRESLLQLAIKSKKIEMINLLKKRK